MLTTKIINAPQPVPQETDNSVSVTDVMIMFLDDILEANQGTDNEEYASVIRDIKEDFLCRREGGLDKYGIELVTFNGRNPLADLYQELLDAMLYCVQASIENADDEELADNLVAIQRTIGNTLIYLRTIF